MKRAIAAALQVTLLVGLTTVVIGNVPAHAVGLDGLCPTGTTLPANDDGSTGPVSLGFTADFFGTNYTDVYVNNNGNVTFNSPSASFTPSPIGTGLGFPIIAPFWADVDTRGGGSGVVTYGTTTLANGDLAFCATWDGVGYYSARTDKLNKFQLVLEDRSSDQGPGAFDIVFRYNQIQWESGEASNGTDGLGGFSARAGYSDGQSGGTSYELPGSGVNGALLDSNATTGLVNNDNGGLGGVPGYYAYPVRNGAPPSSSISGTVWNDLNGNGQADTGGGGSLAPPAPGVHPADAVESGEPGVTVCLDADNSGTCDNGETAVQTDENGNYLFDALTAGTYHVQLVVPDGWHNTGAVTHYDRTIASGENNNGNDFFIQQNVVSSPTLTLTKSDSPDPVEEQNPITYTMQVGNSGNGNASDVVLTDNLPAGTTFNQVTTTQGTCSNTATTVSCDLGTLAPSGEGGAQVVTLIIQAPNVTADTTITNNASVSASNADTVNASADTLVQVNTGGSTGGTVPPGTVVPLTFTTSTQSSGGQPAVNSGDKTSVTIVVPPDGPGGTVQLDEQPCSVAPCTGGAAPNRIAPAAVPKAKIVLGGVVFNVVPPTGYSIKTPFRVTLLYDVSLHPTAGPVFYFKQGVTPTEIKLPHCGPSAPNGSKPCVLKNAPIVSNKPLTNGDWRVVVRIGSDPKMRK